MTLPVLDMIVLAGIEAVIWTDVLQSLILIGGALIVLLLLFGMPEGPAQMFRLAADQDKFSLVSFAPDVTTSTVRVVLLYGDACFRNSGDCQLGLG